MRLDLHPNGDFYPCPGIDLKLGNIDTDDLEKILANPYLKIIRNLNKYIQGDCKKCDLFEKHLCYGGCRGTTFQTLIQKQRSIYEALVASDPSCFKVKEVLNDKTSSELFFK